jgi:hypothetical protein
LPERNAAIFGDSSCQLLRNFRVSFGWLKRATTVIQANSMIWKYSIHQITWHIEFHGQLQVRLSPISGRGLSALRNLSLCSRGLDPVPWGGGGQESWTSLKKSLSEKLSIKYLIISCTYLTNFVPKTC